MNIGLTSLFSFRPHVGSLEFLARMLEKDGHTLHFFSCYASLPNCHNLEVNSRSKILGCAMCIAGGVESYRSENISRIDKSKTIDLGERGDQMIFSSVATALRAETVSYLNEHLKTETRESLKKSVEIVYSNTKEWIESKKLDAIILFNGRMDMTRAVLEACKDMNLPFLSYEYAWFGNGLQLIPNANCLDFNQTNQITEEFQRKPLLRNQARIAAAFIAKRILKDNVTEWRQYNTDSKSIQWPDNVKGKLKVLILPSSISEFLDPNDDTTEWLNPFDGFDAVLDYLQEEMKLEVSSVLRCHPVWGQTVSGVDGSHIEKMYFEWGNTKDVRLIGSSEEADTLSLIQQADVVLLNRSSSAIEAGVFGKSIICTSSSRFMNSGFVVNIFGKKDLEKIRTMNFKTDPEKMRLVLRFMYSNLNRIPQYVEQVKSISPTKFEYFKPENSSVLIELIESGQLKAWDKMHALNSEEEDIVIKEMMDSEWGKLSEYSEKPGVDKLEMRRKGVLRFIDVVRDLFPRGDFMK